MSFTTKVSIELVALKMDISSKFVLFVCIELLIYLSKSTAFCESWIIIPQIVNL
jgi:hypothetical protein